MCVIYGELNNTPLHALAYFLQKMPEISRKTDEVVIKIMHLYDQLMQQKYEAYRENVEYLDSLAAQHKGTPVGKMMKFLRWNAGLFINPKSKGYSDFSISTIKVVGETAAGLSWHSAEDGERHGHCADLQLDMGRAYESREFRFACWAAL